MVYTDTPTYYYSSSLQDTLASICKSILQPFSLKNRRLPGDQKLAKRQSDNLKWQQESFHKILNLIGLQKEGIVPESEVSAFRSRLLDALIASPREQEAVGVIRDKLLFLQELFYAKCISANEYHLSKRPLLQRLAVRGVEIDCKDVIIGNPTTGPEEEWTEIELRDKESPAPAEKTKHWAPIKSFINWRAKDKNAAAAAANAENSTLAAPQPDKSKRKPFLSPPFDREEKTTPMKWKKWKKANFDKDEYATPYLISGESCTLVASPMGEGPDTKSIKRKIHSDGSSSDFFIDKVLGDNIKKELSRIKSELSATHPNLINLSDDQMDAISNRLPVDKADLKSFFPKSWCDRYGDIVLDVVKKEFKEHIGEMETLRKNTAKEKKDGSGSGRWVAVPFKENEENYHPNYHFLRDHPIMNK